MKLIINTMKVGLLIIAFFATLIAEGETIKFNDGMPDSIGKFGPVKLKIEKSGEDSYLKVTERKKEYSSFSCKIPPELLKKGKVYVSVLLTVSKDSVFIMTGKSLDSSKKNKYFKLGQFELKAKTKMEIKGVFEVKINPETEYLFYLRSNEMVDYAVYEIKISDKPFEN